MRALLLASFFLLAAPSIAVAQHAYSTVHTSTLKSWVDQKKPMTILDARGSVDNMMIPGAIWVPFDATDDQITAAVPSKSTLVVIYCWSESCPASGHLADRMMAMGYTKVYEYPEGLQDWTAKNYPTQSQ